MSDAESQEGLGEEQQSSPATSVVGQQHDPPPYVPEVALPEMGLRRDLKERHVNMIAFSACVGIGLFLQSGKVIFLAGPGLAVVAYLIAGSVMWCTMGSLGEMTALFPIQGSIFVFPARFVDEGVGYAAGWMSWFSWSVIIAAEVMAVAQLWKFQFTEDYLVNTAHYTPPKLEWAVGIKLSPTIWVGIFLVIVFAINCLPVKWYGRLEYLFGCIKMIFIVGLIMFNIVVSVLQPEPHESNGWTYDKPYSFTSQNMTIHGSSTDPIVVQGHAGVFLGMWTAITTVIFSMIGFETVSITAAECSTLETTEAIKMGTRKICLRIILLYTLGTLVVGFNVPYTDPNLRNLAISAITPGQNSIFILAAVRNNIHVWPNIFNGFFIFSATTSGINSLYVSSRILHALASIGEVWPSYKVVQSIRRRLQRTTWGVPHGAVAVSWCFGWLAFLAANATPTQQLGRMAVNSVVSMLIVYSTVCLSYLFFYDAIDEAARGNNDVVNNAQGVDTFAFNRIGVHYPYKSRGQWLKAVYGFCGCALLAVFNGWQSFVRPFSGPDFVASYISIAIFFLIAMAYHVKLDGWNPLTWTRRTRGDGLINPLPQATAREYRVGRLRLPEKGDTGSEEAVVAPNTVSHKIYANFAAVGSWLWVWIK